MVALVVLAAAGLATLALAFMHGGPLGSRAELWLLPPRSAALEPL